MSYASLEACLLDLESTGRLVRVREEVDPYLELAAVHLRVHEAGGPALLFERVKGCRFRAASNLFGTVERSRYIFRDSWEAVQRLIALKNDPMEALRHPLRYRNVLGALPYGLPLKNPARKPVLYQEIRLSEVPQIVHWKQDGGAFVTLPQVYTEEPGRPGIGHANIGMYRIQLSGNDYAPDREAGLHYQLHRGIGVHQTKAAQRGEPLRVSCFVGGPPGHSLAAVMPLPEGLGEAGFAGLMSQRRFRYAYRDGFCVSTDADFVITGTVHPGAVKPEGPFGDHLGYYSLTHPFPVMEVHKVYARKDAIWPFTVVGRPPQEDTSFGALIHELAGNALSAEIPGLKGVNAVDAAGVHPLLLAIGSERYTPYLPVQQPAELLTIANHILGTGQLSLAKYLFITDDPEDRLDLHDIPAYLRHVLERIDLQRDVHFHTNTTIDTLDYSGEGLNSGSKVVLAACGEAKRELSTEVPAALRELRDFPQAALVLPGVVALSGTAYGDAERGPESVRRLAEALEGKDLNGTPLLIVCDDAAFTAAQLNNFLWVAFTRSNPSHDLHGVGGSVRHKHWGCTGPLILDARVKPHHAPALEKDPEVERRIDRLFAKGGSLYGV